MFKGAFKGALYDPPRSPDFFDAHPNPRQEFSDMLWSIWAALAKEIRNAKGN